MDRAEIETKLHADRAWLVQYFVDMPEDDRMRPATPSENDPSVHWTAQDHLVHLAGIEGNFNRMIRRGLEGNANPVGLTTDNTGRERSRDEIMAGVHKMNEDWVERYRGRSLSDVLALGQSVRADTLKLLSELTDEQVTQVLPGAPGPAASSAASSWSTATTPASTCAGSKTAGPQPQALAEPIR